MVRSDRMTIRIALCSIFLGAALHPCIARQGTPQERLISVYGVGAMEVPGDRAQLRFTVRDFGSTLGEAIDKTKQRVSEITAKLQALGLSDTAFFTATFNSGDNHEGKAFLSSSRDFRAGISVRVTIDSLPLIESVVKTLSSAELQGLSDISFSLKNNSEIKLACRMLAVEDAKAKAAALAREFGVRVGEVLAIEELPSTTDGDFYIPNVPRLSAGTIASSGGTYFPQRFTVRTAIRVQFAIE
jgi:uncharacterized protein YggE